MTPPKCGHNNIKFELIAYNGEKIDIVAENEVTFAT